MEVIFYIIYFFINFFMFFNFFKWIKIRKRVKKFVEVNAKCIEILEEVVINPSNYKDEIKHCALYSYEFEGKEYEYKGKIEDKININVGDANILRINPDKPMEVFEMRFFRCFTYFIFTLILNILFLVFLSYFL